MNIINNFLITPLIYITGYTFQFFYWCLDHKIIGIILIFIFLYIYFNMPKSIDINDEMS